MITERPQATRTELLARRAQVAFAGQGRDLLKDKRAALVREFNSLSADVLGRMAELDAAATRSRDSLLTAVAADGPASVYSAAGVAGRDLEVTATSRAVGGVVLVDVTADRVPRPRTARGFSLAASSAALDDAAAAFEHQLDLVLTVAAQELRLRRLAAEIEATTRRVNALEHAVLPRLISERDAIAATLADRDRDDLSRIAAARRPHRITP